MLRGEVSKLCRWVVHEALAVLENVRARDVRGDRTKRTNDQTEQPPACQGWLGRGLLGSELAGTSDQAKGAGPEEARVSHPAS